MKTSDRLRIHLSNLFKARFPIVYIPTWEEVRAVKILADIASEGDLIKTVRKVYVWTQTKGMGVYDYATNTVNRYESETIFPVDALDYVNKTKEPALFIFKDFHVYFGAGNSKPDYTLIRKLRDSVDELKNSVVPKNIILISPSVVLPADLQKDVSIVEMGLPTVEEIEETLDNMIEANRDNSKIQIVFNRDNNGNELEKRSLCESALGLTISEVENALARAMVEHGRLSIEERDIIQEEKCQIIKKTGILEFVKSDLSIDDIGGLQNLKNWLRKRERFWQKGNYAAQYNLPAPKGILITGVPGCGKSLTAKAISALWRLPLLRLDMGKIFSGIVGSSEENMRKAIQTAEAVSPSILWIDEIEKGFRGATGPSGDSGTTTRIFGTFLTWMQEKTEPVFVVATANNISDLPPELLRKGRFDEIFFVDLPTSNERKTIFKLHLSKRLTNSAVASKTTINDALLDKLASETEGFSGAEIEQIVIAALFEAFSDSKPRPLYEEDLHKTIHNMVPLSKTQSEQIMQIRNWANVRAVAATSSEDRDEYIADINPKNVIIESSEPEESIKRQRGGRSVDF